MKRITVYCGANQGNDDIYVESAQKIGAWLAKNQYELVYGGGNSGLMGILADTVLHAGGKVIGVMPGFLKEREIPHPNLTELYIVDNMSERKNKMMALGECFIALPGGLGTLEEITEVVSWARIGQQPYPCIFYNAHGFYDDLQRFFAHLVSEGFLTQVDRKKTLFSNSIQEIETFIVNYTPPTVRTYEKHDSNL